MDLWEIPRASWKSQGHHGSFGDLWEKIPSMYGLKTNRVCCVRPLSARSVRGWDASVVEGVPSADGAGVSAPPPGAALGARGRGGHG